MTSPPAPAPAPRVVGASQRFVNVRADLMPAEILSKRQTEVVRRQVVLGLGIVVILLLVWFGMSWWQTESANGDLSDAQRQTGAYQQQIASFGSLVTMQNQTQALQDELQQLLAGDLSWPQLLATLRGVAPAGVQLTSVSGNVNGLPGVGGVTSQLPSGLAVLNQTGKQAVGVLTLAGTAGSNGAVAAYADRLKTVKGVTSPLITTLTTANHRVTFGITAVITSDAAGSRFTPSAAAPQTGGH
jgi:Tfp pilus assembly protein PilN